MQLGPIDLEYLHQDKIGGIIAEGLTVLYEKKPESPVQYLAYWLLQYNKTQENKQKFDYSVLQKAKEVNKFIEQQYKLKLELEEQLRLKNEHEKQEQDFIDKINNDPYHEELINQEYPDYMQRKFKLSSVNICKFVNQKQEVDIDLVDDETAFTNTKAQKLLYYIGTSVNQRFLQNTYLSEQATITYDVLKPPQPLEDGTIPQQKGTYIPNVVKEPKIYFHRFPSLGAYYTFLVVYETFLFEDAFDQGLTDCLEYQKKIKAQELDISQRKEQLDQDLLKIDDEEEKNRMIEEFNEYKDALQQIDPPSFLSQRHQLVFCVDTLRQDREISEVEREQIYEFGQLFGQGFSKVERELLQKDIDAQIQYLESAPQFIFQDELQTYVEEKQINLEEFKTNELVYSYEVECLSMEFNKKLLQNQEYLNKLFELTQRRVIKFPNILKAIFLLLGYTKDETQIENVLNWKYVKTLVNEELISKVLLIDHRGPKAAPLQYSTVSRLEKLIEKYEPEKIYNYNIGLGILYDFLQNYFKLRRLDIDLRKALNEQIRQQIKEAQQQIAELIDKRDKDILQATEEFQPIEEGQEFNLEQFTEKWNTDNPFPIVHADPVDDVDEDLE
ncbi:hypothetical protein pb186bvf_009161 [Paramecium bursaria]